MLSMENKTDYSKIVDSYSDMIFRIAYQNLFNRQDAEDIMQEVFLSLLKSGKEFESSEHLKAWLIKVTVNKCIDLKKSFWRRNTASLNEALDLCSPQETQSLEELKQLSKAQRNIIYLYYYEGYNISEIAKILGENVNTVNSRLQRARKKLKLLIEKGGNNYETERI